ncbi:hypothetical protein EUX98_g5902 [Antrodiella citrinella]|uniref:Nuclear protein localization protein 4 n=1 Tax=Antrodiella citrinella TaxID=2447956 RepID=A0A4V3XIA3_9APHY|nr:hypothetical protein EUX98_g5902 [Antrodiella citrinella]
MCDYCMPLEPYDTAYHTEHSIKHLSYHAYLQKLQPKGSKTTSTTSTLPSLAPLSYKVKVPCPSGGHPNWPGGICTACQPSAITLQSQPFRMVDHLEIASVDVIERFLEAWRKTGTQRFGWLIGRYEAYDKVPMGVKAVVEAIHEPPQQGELDGLVLGLPWEEEQRIRELGKLAGTSLTIVGYIFTDIVPDPEDKTINVFKRHPQSFFLSGLEAIFAATVQRSNPTPSRSSSTGQFASRMVTAVLTGTEDGAIDVSAYQVSEQACAMVEADMIEASLDPGIVRVKEEDRSVDSARYVPDVFFRYKNEYGLEVKKSAKPCFPVEYLLVNVSHGFPQAPSPLFRSTKFAIENRPGLETQNIETVLRELSRLGAPDITEKSGADRSDLLRYLSDWHLVAFLGTTQLISQDDMKVLIQVASAPNLDDPSVLDSLIRTESWHTLMTFARETAPARPSSSAPGGSHTDMDEDISPEIFEQIAREEASRAAAGGADTPQGNIRVCPHSSIGVAGSSGSSNSFTASSAGPFSSSSTIRYAPPTAPPMPNPATGSANPAASLPALWGYLQPALDHIVRSSTNTPSKAPPIDVAYHMGIHTAVYNYFTAQSEANNNAPVQKTITPAVPFTRFDKGKTSGTDLYEQLDRYYADTAREIFLGAPHDDATLVHYLVPCFNRFSAGTQSVHRLLNYVNRHYVKRAVDEDMGWLRLADVFDAVAKSIQESDTREQVQKRLKERRTEVLISWGYQEGGSPELLGQAEARAEAASTPDRVIPLSTLGYRRFRIDCIDPLLSVPKSKKGKKKKIPSPNGGPPMPKGRLARAVKELLEGEGGDVEERRRLAGELAILLRTVGVRPDHPLRKKVDKYDKFVVES